jgi:hypothetical protein
MAKRGRPAKSSGDAGGYIENLAAEVGRLFGTTEVYTRRWLDQRAELRTALTTVRDRASALLSELGEGVPSPFGRRKRGAPQGVPVVQPGMRESRKKRVLSAQAREKMAAAAKARWAEAKKTGRKTLASAQKAVRRKKSG